MTWGSVRRAASEKRTVEMSARFETVFTRTTAKANATWRRKRIAQPIAAGTRRRTSGVPGMRPRTSARKKARLQWKLVGTTDVRSSVYVFESMTRSPRRMRPFDRAISSALATSTRVVIGGSPSPAVTNVPSAAATAPP